MKHNLFSLVKKEKHLSSPLLAALLCVGFALNAVAAEPAGQDREIMEKAKGKKYRNGAEEGELQVQAQLFKPQRKISPVIDKNVEPENSQDHD